MRRSRLAAVARVATSLALIAAVPLTAEAQQISESTVGVRPASALDADSTRRRPKAIEYSEAYELRLRIHRIGSYTMFPLFAAEYLLGDRLLQENAADWVKPAHVAVASGLGLLFVSNTVTGVWNLVESNRDPAGRSRRLLHSALMIAADAGFAYTGLNSSNARESEDNRSQHKNAALVSMGISTVGTVMMWLWKD